MKRGWRMVEGSCSCDPRRKHLLAPCPFCGSSNLGVSDSVGCYQCAASGPVAKEALAYKPDGAFLQEAQAVKLWNQAVRKKEKLT